MTKQERIKEAQDKASLYAMTIFYVTTKKEKAKYEKLGNEQLEIIAKLKGEN